MFSLCVTSVDEVSSIERITANADTEGLSKTNHGCLVNCFIREGARPGDHSDASRLMNVAWHDANLACPWSNDAWAVGADEPGLALSQEGMFDLHHVLLGNPLCDANDQRDFSFQGFHDCCCSARWRHIDHSCIRLVEFWILSIICK